MIEAELDDAACAQSLDRREGRRHLLPTRRGGAIDEVIVAPEADLIRPAHGLNLGRLFNATAKCRYSQPGAPILEQMGRGEEKISDGILYGQAPERPPLAERALRICQDARCDGLEHFDYETVPACCGNFGPGGGCCGNAVPQQREIVIGLCPEVRHNQPIVDARRAREDALPF